jgi:hypothetical protein
MDKNRVLVSSAILFDKRKGGVRWFIVRQAEKEDWEIAKVIVRKGESSVRAALRMLGEMGGMTTKVLEEVGRAGGVTTVNGKTMPQRHLYYLVILQSTSGEALGFEKHAWLDYASAVRKLSSKRERMMLKDARTLLRKLEKENKAN